jgi:hypothetical protein
MRIRVPSKPLSLTKIVAVTRQVEAAIAALVRGHFDIAITLAGAAEDMIDRESSHLFAFLRDQPNANKKAWIRHLNHRGWFKRAGGPDRLVIERFFRAVTKLEASRWTPPMKDFQVGTFVT